MVEAAVIDPREFQVTPFFKIVEVENVPKSETAGRAIYETKEMVEVRIAGNNHYAPMFPAEAMYRRDGLRIISYAERWAEQYRAFKEGDPQEAMGTPLEMLRPYGVSPQLISLCRALKIYSVESLHRLEGAGAKALGMHSNELKEAARKFMAERLSGVEALSEIERLKAQIAALEASGSTVPVPAEQEAPEAVEAIMADLAEKYVSLSDDQIKDKIKDITGVKPRGNPSRPTLENMLSELEAA